MSQFLSYLLILSFFFFINSLGTNSSPLLTKCLPHVCGNVTIEYPFWYLNEIDYDQQYYCGYPGFGIRCQNDEAVLGLPGDRNYSVKDINNIDHTLTLVDIDVTTNQTCPRPRQNFSLETLPNLNYSSMDLNLSFYFNCTPYPPSERSIQCLNIGSNRSYVFVENHETVGFDWSNNCEKKVVVTVIQTEINIVDLIDRFGGAMNDGFLLDWKTVKGCVTCESSEGYCGYNATAEEFLCFCADGSTHRNSCKGMLPWSISRVKDLYYIS